MVFVLVHIVKTTFRIWFCIAFGMRKEFKFITTSAIFINIIACVAGNAASVAETLISVDPVFPKVRKLCRHLLEISFSLMTFHEETLLA